LIVQCEHCQTKYRIADEKVKGKGVKVRCAKCQNVFTVAPPESDTKATTAMPPSTPAPPVEQSIPSQVEGPQPPAPAPPEPPSPLPKEESALSHASSVVDGPPGLPPLPPLGGTQDSPMPEEQQPAEETVPASGDFTPSSLEEEQVDFGTQRPAHEMDQPGFPDPSSNTTEQPEEGGLEIEGTMREGTAPESDPFGAETGEEIPALPPEPGPGAEWGNIAIDGQAPSNSAEGGFGLADGSDFTTPPPPPPMEEPQEQGLPGQMGGTTPGTTTVPAYEPEAKTSGGGKKGLVFLLLLAALGGGGYYAYPTVMEMIQARGGQTEGVLTPANIQVKALNRADGKILYTVRGEVRNESAGNVGMIQVEAQFRNASDDVLSKARSFCGNLFEDSDLISLDLKKVRSNLKNELGQSLSNASIAPGQAVPFLLILDNPPSGVSKVTVTILSFKETT